MDKSSGDWRSPEGGCTWMASDDLDPWGREWHVSDTVYSHRYIVWVDGFLWRCTWRCADTSFLWETLVVPPHCHLDLQSPNKHPGRHRGVKSDWSGAGVPGGAPVVHFWTHWSRSPWPKKSKDETEISGRKVRWRNNNLIDQYWQMLILEGCHLCVRCALPSSWGRGRTGGRFLGNGDSAPRRPGDELRGKR